MVVSASVPVELPIFTRLPPPAPRAVVSTVNNVSAAVAFWITKAVAELVASEKVAEPLAVKALLLATVVAPLSELVPEPVEKLPEPFWVKFLLAVMEVSPFRVTLPVPVAKVPDEALWSKLEAPPTKLRFWPEPIDIPPLAVKPWVTVRAPPLVVVIPEWPMVIAEALVLPRVTVPVVPVLVPTSIETLPEAKAPEVTLPVTILILLVATPAILVVVR